MKEIWIVTWGTFGMVAFTKPKDAEMELISLRKQGYTDARVTRTELLAWYPGD